MNNDTFSIKLSSFLFFFLKKVFIKTEISIGIESGGITRPYLSSGSTILITSAKISQ